jgi:lipid-binding SYLF domain-containing protein
MRKVIILVAINIVATLAFASAQVVYYNNRSSSPQTFTYLDSNGRFAGDSVQTGNIVTFHDANGNMTGSAVTTSPPLSVIEGETSE